LEQQVVETVSAANTAVSDTVVTVKEAVQDTVDTVKETVDETLERVKDTFDVPLQVRRHPWLMVGGSVALGYAGGYLLERREPRQQREALPPPSAGYAQTGNGLHGSARAEREPEYRQNEPAGRRAGVGTWLAKELGPEISKLKALAIGALMGVARDAVVPSLSGEVRTRVEEVINGLTTRMGGEVFHEPLIVRETNPGGSSTTRAGQEPDYLSTMGRPRGAAYGR
jgi:ElaB/YqjD/DUF883 family membrane-anchored ribosome-binding protein